MQLLLLQLQISMAVMVVLLLRQAMKKMPKIYSYLLWILVFARLLCPFSVESSFSFMPSLQVSSAWVEQVIGNVTENVTGNAAENIAEVKGEASELTDSEMQGLIAVGDPNQEPGMWRESLNAGNTSGEATDVKSEVGENTHGWQGYVPEGSGAEGDEVERSGEEGNVLGVTGAGLEGLFSGVSELLSGEMTETAGNESGESSFMTLALLSIWFVGAVVILGYNGFALAQVHRRTYGAYQLQDWEQGNRLNDVHSFIKKGFEKGIPVYVCQGISAPFTLGLIRPRIYLPVHLEQSEREYILCHECVHISRKDYLVKNLAFLLTAIYWFNPLVWVAFYFMERDMEMSCDEKVIKLMGMDIKRQYSQSLLNFAEGKGGMAVTPLTFGENSVKQRVKNVLSYKNARKWSIAVGAVALLAVVMVLFTTGENENVQRNEQQQSGDSGQQSQSEQGDNEQKSQSGQGESGQQNQSGGEGQSQQSNHEQLTAYDSVETKEQFESLYGEAGNYALNPMGYSDSFYRSIMQQLYSGTNKEYFERYTDPLTAAVELLNLGEGAGEIVGDLTAIGGSAGANGDNGGVTDSVGTAQGQIPAEGSRVLVTYTFSSDNSQVEIPMVCIDGVFGLWAPEGTAVREIYRSQSLTPYENESPDDTIQLTQYGFYRSNSEGLTCLYPYYVNPKNNWTVSDGILYFVVDSQYQEGDSDYTEDAICMLDLSTGEFDKEALQLGEINRVDAPIQYLNVYGGFVSVFCNEKDYFIPLVNTGKKAVSTGNTYNGKAVIDLTEAEQDAYGVAIRQQLLANPGQLLKLSNRTLTENFVLIDLNGDGETERITLSKDLFRVDKWSGYMEYDFYQFQIEDSAVTGDSMAENLFNEIWAFSLDGKEIVLAIYEDGPSGDPQTHLFMYKDGATKVVGSFPWDIQICTIENGIIYGNQRADILQTDWIKAQWQINTNGELEFIEQETYEFCALNQVNLLEELPVYDSPKGDNRRMMQPQSVRFLMTDKTFEWVYAEGEDGTGGWFYIQSFRIPELEKDCMEVFENLSFAG